MYKLFVKAKNNQSAEYIRTLLKSKVNPTQMKVEKRALKTLKNDLLLIESDKKSECWEFVILRWIFIPRTARVGANILARILKMAN